MPPAPRSRPSASLVRGRPSAAPVYQPPENPLDNIAQQNLANLKRLHHLNSVEKHLKDANQLLADCVFEANKILADRERDVEKRRAKADRDGVERDAREQAELEQRQKAVRKLNTDIDTKTRKTIDEQYAVEYMRQSLDDAARMAGNAPNLPISQAASFDPTMPDAPSQPESGPPPSDTFKRGIQAKIDGWQQMALQARYSQHPDYVNFKKHAHDGAHGDDVPMQPASRWFGPARGSPAPGTTRAHGADDSDDDIIIARETTSTKCPLSLRELEDPVMNKHCRHVFEKAYIMQMVGRSEIDCPTTGCNKKISKASLHVDQALLKKIKRIQQSKQATQNAEDDSDDDDRPADGCNANMSILLDETSGDDHFDTLIDDADNFSAPKVEPQSSRPPAGLRASQVVTLGEDDDESDE
ncbi:chromosomal organization and dna repair protein [Venturia nashicola]|uniref:Chromosomal organization and dna repair protein n=1 Tax=Venturia nashicola TaxID=86259 RepID=A0A4Z1PDE1_9PEZI|nr:chromosomal organization and dna repair protein [Venturia nashicola]TLD32323.1 chromosomal organization and dna repair protein [Venturia nashicola]